MDWSELMQDNLPLNTINDRLHKQTIPHTVNIDSNTAYECLNIFKRKVIASGLSGNPITDVVSQMQSSFESALSNSPNSEQITILEEPQTPVRFAIITENGEVDWDMNDKNIALPFSQYAEVGRTVSWTRTGDKYLIMAQNDTQKAYFSGIMRYANYLVKWTDGISIYQQWAVIDGPGKAGGGFDLKSSIDALIDDGQHEIQLYIARTLGSEKIKRYDRIYVNNKAWRIVAINDMEDDNFIKLFLKENYQDLERDDVENGIASNEESNVDNFQAQILDDLDLYD